MGQTARAYNYGDPSEKFEPSIASRLSRSPKVVTDTDRSVPVYHWLSLTLLRKHHLIFLWRSVATTGLYHLPFPRHGKILAENCQSLCCFTCRLNSIIFSVVSTVTILASGRAVPIVTPVKQWMDKKLLKFIKTRSLADADKHARRGERSVKVGKHSTFPYVRYSLL